MKTRMTLRWSVEWRKYGGDTSKIDEDVKKEAFWDGGIGHGYKKKKSDVEEHIQRSKLWYHVK